MNATFADSTIVFATLQEAQETIALKDFDVLIPDTLYQYRSTKILITGMGPKLAFEKTLHLAKGASKVYNFGIVGSLKKEISLFSWHFVSRVTESTTLNSLPCSMEGSHLLTLEEPLHDETKRDLLNQYYDLVDLEGFAIAKAAMHHNIPVFMYKIVSDFCSANTTQVIRQHLPFLSKEIAKKIQEMGL